ncbi:MAG: TIGR02710 family CRISPR-associated CARF protein [Acidimicrobiales bacterium]
MKLLLITVGGSPEPLRTSLATAKADRVVFVTSERSVEVAKQLAREAGLSEAADPGTPGACIIVVPPDDLGAIYDRLTGLIDEERRATVGSLQLQADYTGGTKSMCAALAMAVVDAGGDLLLTTAPRTDLTAVRAGQATRRLQLDAIHVRRLESQLLPSLLERYAYRDAAAVARQLLVDESLDPKHVARLRTIATACDAFDAWDRLALGHAFRVLDALTPTPKPHLLALKRVIRATAVARHKLTPTEPPNKVKVDGETVSCGVPIHGFEPVEDLLANAERRANQGRFDDGVGRLYRAFELTAQLALWYGFELRTDDIDPERVRSHNTEVADRLAATRDHRGRIRLPAWRAWELLVDLAPTDPSTAPWVGELANAFTKQKKTLLAALETRNHSLFAHGYDPIGPEQYDRFRSKVGGFLSGHLQRVQARSRGDAEEPLPKWPTSVEELLGTSGSD